MTATARLDAATVREAARGRWQSFILPKIKITVPIHPRKHAPCPACGGKDRFRFDDRDGLGTYFCNQCDPQSGDGLRLVQNVRGCDFPEALQLVAGVLGLSPTREASVQRPLPPPKIRIDRKSLAFRYELAALDRRLRADAILHTAMNRDVSGVSDEKLDKLMSLVASAYSGHDRADLFEHVCDTLMDKHSTHTRSAR